MIADFVKNRALLSPTKTAFIDYSSGVSRNFDEIEKRSNRLAAYLHFNGVRPQDTIGVLCRNRVEFFELLFACAKIGAILVPFNWRSPAMELIPLVGDVKPKLVFYGKEDEVTCKEISNGISTIGFDKDFELILDNEISFSPRLFWPDDECWYLIFTSGTTGKPKAVMQTYRMALANAVNIGQAINIQSDDRFLNFLPLFHTAGINLHTIPAFLNGCVSWIIDGFDAGKVLDLIGRNEINCFFGVPQVYLLLAQSDSFKETDFKNMKSWGCGGAPLPDYLVETFKKRGAIVCNGMGMTETGPTVFMMNPEYVSQKIGSVGKSQILTIARVVDEDFKDCPPNCAGDLVFAGPNITPGYWQNEKATNEAFTIDENNIRWLKSGDLARIDEDGYFYIVGRSKEMFISGGENVYPAEVENALLSHENIVEIAVLGVSDEKWGEVGAAFIRTDKEMSKEEIKAFCKSRLAGFKIPKHILFVSDFPRTAAGKIQKHLLKIEFENGN